MPDALQALDRAIDGCLLQDRHRLRSTLRRLQRERRQGRDIDGAGASLAERIQASTALLQRRRAAVPSIDYPADLPVSQRVDDIRAAIEKHQVVIVAGETGSGKTTQLPKICLSLGRGVAGMIGHTQPRRLAARSVASRIAEELRVSVGREVGYQVRFSDTTSELSFIKLMTDGVLLAEIQQDPWLNRYDTIIIDEAHERSLNIDFLLGYLKRLLPRRPDLKLIVTSATIDVEKFSRHFGDAPIVEVSGRTYPVDVLYRPPEEGEDADLGESVLGAVREIQQLRRERPGTPEDILVFLSGEREIRDVANTLRKAQLPHTEVLPLYARLSNAEQNRVFQPHPGRRIVLATNVAETSLTVPGIGYVIDQGKARISRYSARSKIQRLPVESVSKASANQRAGRCGRVGPGLCIRLYAEEDFAARPDFTDTEITRTNLASVILQMLSLGLGDIEDFPFLDRPEAAAINDGFRLLQELGAVDAAKKLTPRGRQMARLPVDPRLARMMVEAAARGSLRETLVIVSALSIQDPRERPLDKQQAADEKHRAHQHPESDFLAFVKLWEHYEAQRQELSQGQLRKYCQQHFLSWLRMREWRELHTQLHLLCRELKLAENREPADYDAVHQALLSGLLGNIAWRMDDGAYLGARNRKFQIFPGSALFKKKPRWLMAAELVETSQVYARTVASIDPLWAERLAGELVKKQVFEPHWEKRQGQVMAFEKVSLYGLVLVEKRRIALARVDPVLARELFIREGLVAQQLEARLPFYRHNRELIARLEALEDKTRRRDILVDDETLFRFYDERLPAEVFDRASLERWLRREEPRRPGLLRLSEQDLLQPQAAAVDPALYPDQLETPAMSLKLDYHFDPGQARDGVSVEVPVSALRQLREEDLDWLVPGMLREKCVALVKALPKGLRKHFVPVPETVDRLLPKLPREGSLRLQLATQLKRLSGIDVPLEQWNDYQIEEHLRMNIAVLDESGKVLGMGRDLAELRERFAAAASESLRRHAPDSFEREGLRDWSFGALPTVHELEQGGVKVRAWPALVDGGDSVALRLLDNEQRALAASRLGIARLALLACPQQAKHLQRQLLQDPRGMAAMKLLGGRDELLAQLITKAALQAFDLEETLPRDAQAFQAMLQRGKGEFIAAGERLERLLYQILGARQEVQKSLEQPAVKREPLLHADLARQLTELVHPHFLRDTPVKWLREIPRYLQAIVQRLEKYPRQVQKDREWTAELGRLWERYAERRDWCRRQDLPDERLEDFRWLLEEYRVSLFAQQLGTRAPVSGKRLEKLWDNLSG